MTQQRFKSAFLTFLVLLAVASTHAAEITVFAAVSLTDSLKEIAAAYEKESGDHATFNFDSSGKLAAQIKQGAPVDAFVSADNDQMDKLIASGKVDKKASRMIVGNSLVLIAPADEKDAPKSFADLAIDHGKKIAIGEPKTVPAGRYAMQTLKSLKLDEAVSPRLVYGESVRQVLIYVEQDEVYAGIVYSTDAIQAGNKVKMIDPRLNPRLKDAIGIFKVAPTQVENNLLVARAMAGEGELKTAKIGHAEIADYLIAGGLG